MGFLALLFQVTANMLFWGRFDISFPILARNQILLIF